MKVRDARAIINSKKREQQLQKIPATNARIVDARQILKSKRKKNKSKFKASVEIPTALVKKELGEVLKSAAGQKDTSKNKKNMQFNKHVEFAQGGILTVTSKGLASSNIQSRKPSSFPTSHAEKFIVNNRKSIVVIKPNELAQQTRAIERPMDIDPDDDLENLTLEDFPDIKTLPRGLSSSLKAVPQGSVVQRTPWKPGFSSVSNQLQLPANTMVADTVEVTNNSSLQQQQGYTVYVTNLRDTVTQEDIVELFSDVGPLASAQLLQPGTALVVYFTKAEASQACDSYHNRLLDGQPMQCSLLPSSVSTGRSSLFSRLGCKVFPDSGLLPTSPSASTFLPSATFQQPDLPQASKSQRSVQFTVKLP